MTRLLIGLLWLAFTAPVLGNTLTIEVQRLADGRWQVDYHSDQPIERLLFTRNVSLFRNERWQADEARFETAAGYESLRPHQATRHLSVRMSDVSETLVRDYELLRPFTDGSAALYTGHLAALPVSESVDDPADALARADQTWTVRYRFHPRPNEWVVLAGERSSQPIDWQDADGWGRYVYFGAIDPLAGDHVLAVIDPGLPAWTVSRLNRLLPRLFDLYAERIGGQLTTRPVVLFSFVPSASGGLESGGGALPGLLQLFLKGDDWLGENATTAYQVDYLLAHEAAHLWNHQRGRNADAANASWLHEGGADALTHQALVELGRLDRRRRQVLLDRALNTCLKGLRGRGLEQATGGADFGLQYACGEVIYALVSGDDPFSLTAALIEVAESRGGEYGLSDFLAIVARHQPGLVGPIEGWVHGQDTGVEAAIADAVEAAGLRLEISEQIDDRRFGAQLAADGLAHLMAQACDGRFSFSAESDGFRLYPIQGCTPFEKERKVLRLQGLAVIEEGPRVHDAVVEGCRNQGAVELAGEAETWSVTCRLPLAPRAPYRRLVPR